MTSKLPVLDPSVATAADNDEQALHHAPSRERERRRLDRQHGVFWPRMHHDDIATRESGLLAAA